MFIVWSDNDSVWAHAEQVMTNLMNSSFLTKTKICNVGGFSLQSGGGGILFGMYFGKMYVTF